MENFSPAASSRRRLQNVAFVTFDTEVRAKDEDFDATGNTIIYDQFIKFSTIGDALTEDQGGDLLLFYLTDTQKKNQYLEMLKTAHPDFESVTEINPATSRSTGSTGGGDDDDGFEFSTMWIIIIAVGGAILCCCFCALLIALCNARNKDEQEMDYDNENDVDHGAPEGPVYDHSEKSGEEIFSNETQHKDMPYGQDEDDDYESGPAPTMDESHEVSEESSSGHDLDWEGIYVEYRLLCRWRMHTLYLLTVNCEKYTIEISYHKPIQKNL